MKSKVDYVLWEVTQKCNLCCIHCRADSSFNKKEEKIIEGEDVERLLDDIVNIGGPTLALTGGEPLLRKDIVDIVESATLRGIPVRIQSNGLLLSQKIARDLKNAKIMSFGIGIDGPNAMIHDKIRNKKGAFKNAIDAIKILKEENIKVHVEYTATKINYKSIDKTIDLLEDLNVDTFLARAAIFAGRANVDNEIFKLSNTEYRDFLKKIAKERKKRKIIINSQDPLYHLVDKDVRESLKNYGDISSGKVISGCTASINMMHVHSDGEVGVCTFLPQVVIGDFFKKSLSDIWEERVNCEDIKSMMQRKLKGFCGSCPDRFICGGCRARAMVLCSDILQHDPYCWRYCKTKD